MNALKIKFGLRLNRGLTLGLVAGLFLQASLPSWSDVIHFRSGQSVRGKLGRVTGDIIDFKRSGGVALFGSLFGNQEIVQRIRISNRHDVVETRDHQKHFGEIIYVDKFKIELRTASGHLHLNRLNVRNIVLGSPMEEPGNAFSNLSGTEKKEEKGIIPAAYQPSGTPPSMPASHEEGDLIPGE